MHMVKYPSIKKADHKDFKSYWYEIIFEADTKEGRRFDILLLYAILLSILAVMAESVPSLTEKYGMILTIAEYIFTVLFTLEYLMRIYISPKPRKYIFSFFGIIDLLSTIPKYLSFILVGSHSLVALRALRLLRIFRILKLALSRTALSKDTLP